MTQRYLNVEEEQTVNYTIGGRSFLFRFYGFRDIMYMDVKEGETNIMAGKRVMANRWILPSYIAEGYGNLRFETYASDANDYVWWEGFNTKFRLVSYTDAELKNMEKEEE